MFCDVRTIAVNTEQLEYVWTQHFFSPNRQNETGPSSWRATSRVTQQLHPNSDCYWVAGKKPKNYRELATKPSIAMVPLNPFLQCLDWKQSDTGRSVRSPQSRQAQVLMLSENGPLWLSLHGSHRQQARLGCAFHLKVSFLFSGTVAFNASQAAFEPDPLEPRMS
jgi:hypothetical protein